MLCYFTQIAGNILFGAGCSGVHVTFKMHSERGPSDEPISSAEHWSVFTDSTLAPQAEKLVLHMARQRYIKTLFQKFSLWVVQERLQLIKSLVCQLSCSVVDKTSARRMAFVKCILVTITTVKRIQKKLVISYGDQVYIYICILISDLVTNLLSEALLQFIQISAAVCYIDIANHSLNLLTRNFLAAKGKNF